MSRAGTRLVTVSASFAVLAALSPSAAQADHGRESDFLSGSGTESATAGVYNVAGTSRVEGMNLYGNNTGGSRTVDMTVAIQQCNGYGQSCGTFAAGGTTYTVGNTGQIDLFTGNPGSFGHTYRTCISDVTQTWNLLGQCTNLIAWD